MRLDKYLKVSRLIKRRTLAKEVCDGGKININGRIAKAGTEVKEGDLLTIDFGHKVVKIKVLATPKTVSSGEVAEIFEEI